MIILLDELEKKNLKYFIIIQSKNLLKAIINTDS